MKFSEWMNKKEENAQLEQSYHVNTGVPTKKWKATKKDILHYWRALEAQGPIRINPIDYDHEGSTYGQDGVRITGSRDFISSVLARLKEFLNYETPNSKLQVVYRETESKDNVGEPSYVFYIQVKERGHGKKLGGDIGKI